MAKFDEDDLRRLTEIGAVDRAKFFERNPRWRQLYEGRLLAVALCQGAALDFVNGTNGVKDLDVWTFYAAHPDAPFPSRRRGKVDFGVSKFGRHPNDHNLVGRRVDLLARSVSAAVGADPVSAIQAYVRDRRTDSAREPAAKAVVLLDPIEQRGRIVWPLGADNRGFKSR